MNKTNNNTNINIIRLNEEEMKNNIATTNIPPA